MLVGEEEAAVEVGRLMDHMDVCAWRGRANRLSGEHVAWGDIEQASGAMSASDRAASRAT